MIRLIDGFDHYVTADFGKKWSSSNSTVTISAGNGRRGTASFRPSTGAYLINTFDNQQVWMLGFALRFSVLPTTVCALVQWLDAATIQCDLALLSTGALVVRRGGTTTLGTSSTTLGTSSINYLEWRMLISSTVGQAEVVVNGVSWLTLTGVNTQQSANAFAQGLRFGAISGVNIGPVDFDDLYICDGTGAAPQNALLGDCRVDTLLPTSDGTSQQWTPSTPGTHYTLVDEAAPNTTDYVSSSTVGHRETYGMQDLTTMTGPIYGVQLALAALKSDAGARSLTPLLRSGTSEALGVATALSTSQTYTRHIQTTDPATGAAWSEAGVNAMQAGAEVA